MKNPVGHRVATQMRVCTTNIGLILKAHIACFLRNVELMDALVAIDLPVVLLPDAHLRKILHHSRESPKLLAPEYVRAFILKDAARVRKACSGQLALAAALLGYCLVDIDDAHPEALVRVKQEPNMLPTF